MNHDQLLRAARSVGDRLELMAIRWNGNASWFGLMPANERHWSISPLTADLYSGLPGVALFLACLGAVTGERRYTDPPHEKAAYEAVRKAMSLAQDVTESERAYIEALARRYSVDPKIDLKKLDVDYAHAMRELSKRYPDDLDAATLYAESLMDLRPWKL